MLAMPIILMVILFVTTGIIGLVWNSRNYNLSLNMVNQSGIGSFVLYDARDTTFDRVNESEITNISGINVVISNEDEPTFEQKVKIINRRNKFEYVVGFRFIGLDSDTSQFKNKFGWLVLINFLDGETRFINTPCFIQNLEFNTNQTNVYPIELKPNRPTGKTLKVV